MLTLGRESAKARAEGLFSALGARVTHPARNAKYDTARVKIANAAFLPGRIFNDTSVWTSSPMTSRRQLLIHGRFENDHYQLDGQTEVPWPSHAAESRHLITLTKLSDDSEYAWDTEVPYAVGTIPARDIGAFFAAMLAAAEGRDEAAVRADIASTLPTASPILGQLFTIDSIRTTHLPDQSTLASFTVRMHPDGVQQKYPSFARYMRTYAMTTRLSVSLTDKDSASYVAIVARDGKLTLNVRTLRGAMIPLSGPARAMPDTLTLNGDLRVKISRFNVGFHDYHAEFVQIRTPHERGWSIVSREEPQWTLPLITEHLIRTPLRRPFKGSGALFRIGFRDSTGAQTILNRRLHLEVQESLILRFIGRLGATALGDWVGKAEREQMNWLEEVFDAVVEDVKKL